MGWLLDKAVEAVKRPGIPSPPSCLCLVSVGMPAMSICLSVSLSLIGNEKHQQHTMFPYKI